MSKAYDEMMDPDDRDAVKVRRIVTGNMDQAERNNFDYVWEFAARPQQLPPPGDWRVWMIMAGRGFGKTRSGAEWVRMIADTNPDARIALVSSSIAEARAVMVEGESGLMAICRPDHRPQFEPSLHRIRFASGAQAQLFSAAEPEALRGPQHSHAWCDEIGKWPLASERATRCWENLLLGLRLGRDPRIAVTTTPRAVPLVRRLVAQAAAGDDVLITHGATEDNAGHLAKGFIAAVTSEFGGTQLARQELDGELLEDIEGALWTRSLIEAAREHGPVPQAVRTVVAVDPPASAAGDECGIIVAALGEDGFARVLADRSMNGPPAEWAQRVAEAAREWDADRVVAEANQGGAMVESVLRAAERSLPVKLVHASRGKVARAEPVAALYAAGRVRHLGMFARLEDQLCGLLTGGTYAGPGRSPDRADALVWAMTELLMGRLRSPAVRQI